MHGNVGCWLMLVASMLIALLVVAKKKNGDS